MKLRVSLMAQSSRTLEPLVTLFDPNLSQPNC
jgi:hypothetical protein